MASSDGTLSRLSASEYSGFGRRFWALRIDLTSEAVSPPENSVKK
jgi:hypothetical protein